jgi:outer membrane biosynthesis protein TonB
MPGRPLAGLFLALLAAGPAPADDPKLPDAAAFDRLVVDSLRDVHNRGADLYNTAKDHAGAYRMYQGGLVAVRPLLAHRPAAQKLIDDGLAAAEKEANPAQKAFKLHEAIEAVRADLKAPAKPPEKPKPPAEPEPKGKAEKVEPKPAPAEVAPPPRPKEAGKKPADPPTQPVGAKAAGTAGRVTLKGQPLTAAEVTVVSVDRQKPVVFTAVIRADGSYAFAEPLPPGRYVVIVTAKAVPEKYQTTTTSGLVIEVKAGGNTIDLDLK